MREHCDGLEWHEKQPASTNLLQRPAVFTRVFAQNIFQRYLSARMLMLGCVLHFGPTYTRMQTTNLSSDVQADGLTCADRVVDEEEADLAQPRRVAGFQRHVQGTDLLEVPETRRRPSRTALRRQPQNQFSQPGLESERSHCVNVLKLSHLQPNHQRCFLISFGRCCVI